MVLAATGRFGTIGTFYPDEVLGLSFERYCLDKKLDAYPKIDTLIHGGGVVGEPLVRQDLAGARRVNVEKTGELVTQLIEDRGLKRLVYISSAHVYAPSGNNYRLPENSPLGPVNFYAEQKLEAELSLSDQLAKSDVELLILRVFSIFGTNGQGFTLGGRLRDLVHGKSVEIGNADDIRDFLTPSVVARAIYELAKGSHQGILNVCTGRPTRISEAVDSWFHVSNPKGRVSYVAGRSTFPFLVGDPAQLNSVLAKPLEFLPGEA